MKKGNWFWLLSLILAVTLLLAACGGAQQEVIGEDPEPETAEEAVEEEAPEEEAEEEMEDEEMEEESAALEGDPIVLGGLAPLSAPGAVVGGEAMREAMVIAVEELNEAGGILGRPVELVIVDTEGLPERGTAVMEKLINQDNVVAVGGGYHSSVGVAAKEVARDNNTPVVFAETWNDTITSTKYDQIFRIAPLSSEVSAVDVRFVSALPGIEKVVIVTENTDYGIPAAEDTTNGLAESGIEAVTFGVDIGTQDFAGIVERVKAEDPDMIMVLATGEAAYNFQQQAADAGIGPQDVPMMCNQVSLESEAYWTNVPDGNFCFVRRVGLPESLYNDVAKAFVAKYTERTGKEAAESYALEAYDSIMIIAQAIEDAGSTDSDAVITALENITFEGTLGTITFPYGRNNDPADAGVDDKFWHQFPDPAITIVQYQESGQDSTVAPVVFPATYQTGQPYLSSAGDFIELGEVDVSGTIADVGEEEEMMLECDGPIRLGGLAPLSAPGAVVGGEAMREAMNIAAEELNEAGGILGCEVELIIVDTEGLPERGTAVMEKLINQDNVVAVGGGYHSSVGVAAKEVARDNNTPVVFAETWNDTITSSQYDQIFRIAPLSSEVSAVDVRFVTSLPDIGKVVIVTENTDYGIPAAEDTTNGLAESGIEAVTFGVDIGTQDFAGIVERVKAEDPDMIMVLATGEAAYNFTQQAADAGIGPQDVPMMCNQVSLESEAFWTNVPDGNLCFVRRVGLPESLYNDVAKAFVAKYTERTGKEAAESYALEAYDSIMIIAQAITEAGSLEPDAIIAALEGITFEGTLGTITFPYGSENTPEDAGVDPKFWHQFPDPAITIVQYQEEGQDSTNAAVVFPETFQTAEPILVNQ
ncbi:MAG: ABC transporter substrate-binding protein [Ardenticatenaceae bacterium]|nr:ABC transporter substrate-binding protein [Ardenticatenaceae bacterium]